MPCIMEFHLSNCMANGFQIYQDDLNIPHDTDQKAFKSNH